ncbi:transglutaminase-like domain-containing protein [Methylobacterium sp. J-090]|uniref:transglutaminase-like domain-containing protein n=1 Tax=Methylobacterium sp. J-090 TaxID=2836666 RepID=UPI001FB92460|nr:transglutaminase family protein [Methylobacterium sp. J-090]MCJ2083129.1 transglutaminase family protein [Methylobacterium sp. J-090]
MRIRFGCEMGYEFPHPTPLIARLNTYPVKGLAAVPPDVLQVSPPVPVKTFRDVFGNRTVRFLAPAGAVTLSVHAEIPDDGGLDPVVADAAEHPVEDLPEEALPFLVASRYCESDLLSNEAWDRFGHLAPGWSRVQAVCDFVHHHIAFGYAFSHVDRTAADALAGGRGVCRDYAHLFVAFCRALNIPTRYCTGYLSFIGEPEPHGPGDFAAWTECYLGGAWHVFDPRNNAPRRGRILVARGRDAADVPLTHTFGGNRLTKFRVWAEDAAPARQD